jgi:hypothetical protein
VKTSRITRLAALKRQVELQKWMNEAGRLHTEIKRLDDRINQVDALKKVYNQQMLTPALTSKELIGIRIIDNHLNDRREIDQNRRELLEGERKRMAMMLAEKKNQVETLKAEAKDLKKAEAEARAEKLQALIPARRNS